MGLPLVKRTKPLKHPHKQETRGLDTIQFLVATYYALKTKDKGQTKENLKKEFLKSGKIKGPLIMLMGLDQTYQTNTPLPNYSLMHFYYYFFSVLPYRINTFLIVSVDRWIMVRSNYVFKGFYNGH